MQKSNFVSSGLAEAVPRVLLISAALALVACGGGGGGSSSSPSATPVPSPLPTPMPSPNPSPSPSDTVCGSGFLGNATASFTSSVCIRCSSPDQATARQAIDNDADTAAEMDFSGGGSGDITLRANTQPGVVVPAGSTAGALIQYPVGAVASESLEILTFMQGEQQESGGGFTNRSSPSTSSTPQIYNFRTTKPYDRIEIKVTRTGDATTAPIRIIEVCSG